MADAVIVAETRTPIGPAHKGSLVDARPDDSWRSPWARR
jgi:hypothetical protein